MKKYMTQWRVGQVRIKKMENNKIRGYVEIPEDYWESTSTNNEDFEFIYNEKELSDIYI